MNRRTFLKNLGVGVAALSLPGCNMLSRKDSGDALNGKRPNILFILADDQSPFDCTIRTQFWIRLFSMNWRPRGWSSTEPIIWVPGQGRYARRRVTWS